MRARLLLAAAGAGLALYGLALLLTRQEPRQWLEVALWLGAGVVAHDVLLSALVVGAGLLGSRLLPASWRAPAAIALVVWGGLSVVAVPVLVGGGVRADNPTLLDRPYIATWWVVSATVVLLVAVTGFLRTRRAHGEG
ncbi:hypothetical protein NOCD_18855 [Nocardioides cavernae]|uniref:hypothetical protein n=1 Tax=Nocardioides TaxID=1839 RepID=UPI000A8D47AF|nr:MULTISPECIES: hypothetical protein [Nocardioides]MCK9825549.1 hypothetical protein [Nocardioides cavernae]